MTMGLFLCIIIHMHNNTILDCSTYKTAKKGRRFIVMLIDYFLVMLVSFSLFALVVQPIFDSLPSTKEIESRYQEKQVSVMNEIVSTHLQKKDDNDNLISVSNESKNYIVKLLKFSTTKYDDIDYYELKQGKKETVEIKNEELLSYQDSDGNYSNDEILFYYLNFRKQNKSSYSEEITDYSLEDINTKLLKLNSDNKNLVSSDFDVSKDIFYLNKENINIILDYVNYSTDSGKSLYQNLVLLYRTVVMTAISEIEKNYTPYVEKMNAFNVVYKEYSSRLGWSLVLSYVIGFLLCYIPFQLAFKHGRTIGYRFFSLALSRSDCMELKAWNVIVKDVVLFILSFSSIFFMPVLLGKIELLSCSLVGPITLFQVVLFSFLMILVSLVFFFISKSNQSLSDYASQTITVNLNEKEEDFMIEQDRKIENDAK